MTRIASHRTLMSALYTGHTVLKLKLDAAYGEVHHGEGPEALVLWETAGRGQSRRSANRATERVREL